MKKYLINFYLQIKCIGCYKKAKPLKVLSFDQTINQIVNHRKSFSRFGDGEFRMLLSYTEKIGFQKEDVKLSKRLKDIILSEHDNLLVGLPNSFKFRFDIVLDSQIFWNGFNSFYLNEILDIVDFSRMYGDSLITRFYMSSKDKRNEVIEQKIKQLKKIWNNEDVVIVEGKQTKLGIGNDMFDNVKSLKRIICPEKDAFSRYDDILSEIKVFGKDKLILIALGPTATVLAYDLAVEGFWAVDIGHIDIEYMWFLQKAKSKVGIIGKYVNEVREASDINEIEYSDEYEKSIIARIL